MSKSDKQEVKIQIPFKKIDSDRNGNAYYVSLDCPNKVLIDLSEWCFMFFPNKQFPIMFAKVRKYDDKGNPIFEDEMKEFLDENKNPTIHHSAPTHRHVPEHDHSNNNDGNRPPRVAFNGK